MRIMMMLMFISMLNKTFIAENIKITEFYNKLKTKFNTDEEI